MLELEKSIAIKNERKKLKRELTVLPLFGLLDFYGLRRSFWF